MKRTVLAAALSVLTLSGVGAREEIPAEVGPYPYDAELLQCADPSVISKLIGRFDDREEPYWGSSLKIAGIDRIRETAFRPNGRDLIPRRYCAARATLNNGKHHAIYFVLVEDGGISGWQGSFGPLRAVFPTPGSYMLEWCIVGLDRSWTNNPDCKMVQP